MKTVSIKKNIIINTFYQILTMIIPFVTAPYIARVIGPKGVGVYSFTTSIQTYFSMFAALGTVSYGARLIARARDNEEERSKYFWEIEVLTILTSIICLIGWGMLIYFCKEYKIYYLILTMNLLNTMFDISWFYTGLEQFKYTVTQNSIFKILGVILLFIFVKDSSDLGIYMTIMSLTTLLGTMSMWLYLPKFLKKINFKDIKIKYHFKETFIYFIPTIATSIYTVLDKTLIGIITNSEEENGYYEQATKIINMTKALTFTAVNSVVGSRISYLFVNNEIDEIKEKIHTSINYIFFMGFGIMFGLIGVASNFVPLFFGTGYDSVINLIRILSPIVIIIGISNCLGSQYYNPAGLRAQSAKYIIVGSITNLFLNLLFIPKFSSYGAAIATIIAETVISILYLKNCNNFVNTQNLLQYSWKKIIAGIIMLIIIFLTGIIKINSKMLILMLQVIFGFTTYIVILMLLKDDFINFAISKLQNMKIIKMIKKRN